MARCAGGHGPGRAAAPIALCWRARPPAVTRRAGAGPAGAVPGRAALPRGRSGGEMAAVLWRGAAGLLSRLQTSSPTVRTLSSTKSFSSNIPSCLWKLGRLNHVAIAVPDLEKAQSLYKDVLGAQVDDIKAAMTELKKKKIRILSEEPKIGAHGKPVIFLHPKDCHGVLVELEQA
ncbi:methylmalonyl-CoA epimerase, mitochondrial isoform X2 [Prinia subflava]|uniref:methylmalonyl-CoA epimerase, mitochondrial isoform X2 n=1 Tax=Prinia subflava TaxID=208062 RepID=UPI002FE4224F